MSRNDKDQVVSDSLTLNNFKTWSSAALKNVLSLINRSINGPTDVLAARYVPFLNYIEAKFHLKTHGCSTCTCLEFVRLAVSRYIGHYFS